MGGIQQNRDHPSHPKRSVPSLTRLLCLHPTPTPAGGGGGTHLSNGRGGGGCRWGGGGVKHDTACLKPLGAQKIHPVTIYLTKNFHYFAYPVLARTDDLFCGVSSYMYIHKNLLPFRAHRRWCRDRGPVINIVGWEATLCGLGTNPVINGVVCQ